MQFEPQFSEKEPDHDPATKFSALIKTTVHHFHNKFLGAGPLWGSIVRNTNFKLWGTQFVPIGQVVEYRRN